MTLQNEGSIKVVDLFAGAGGFGLGFEMAGYEIITSLEIDQWAADTLRENRPNHLVIQSDIREYKSASEIRSVCRAVPDIMIGGPPCQGFSVAGPAKKDPKDPRNSLFIDFARWVEHLQPKIFVMENVKGLLMQKNANRESVIEIIRRTFIELGYTVEIWLLNAAAYGVPQTRERIFVVGNRIGLEKIGIPKQTHSLDLAQQERPRLLFEQDGIVKPAITLWDAIADLPELDSGQGQEEALYTKEAGNCYQKWARGNQSILYNHVAMEHSSRIVERFKHIGWGESSADVPEEHMPLQRNGKGERSKTAYDQNNRRLYPYKPSHTIAASFYANFIHPFQHRNITAREGARIQSFPDQYRFMGKKTVVSQKLLEKEGRIQEKHLCQYNQIGNAVPPLLARAIAQHIKEKFAYVSSWSESASERVSPY